MPRTLLLMRHAKSSWNNPGLSDFDRQLNKRGHKAAPRIGGYIREIGLTPNLVLCSTAKRAQETWNLVHESLGDSVSAKLMKSLYLASPSQLLGAIHKVSAEIDPLLVIAHNPGIQELACLLERESKHDGAGNLSHTMHIKFPTAAVAILTFETQSWSDIAYGQARLEEFIRPRNLR